MRIEKLLLIEAFKDILSFDKKILNQKKHGFTVPATKWLVNKYTRNDFLKKVSNSSLSKLLNYNFISKIIHQQYSGKFNHDRFIFRLYSVLSWYRKIILDRINFDKY